MNVARRPVRFLLARLAPRACLALVLAVLPGFSSATAERVKPLGMSAEAIDVHRPIFGRKQDQTARERKLDSRLLLASRALAQRRAFGGDAVSIPANVQRFIDGYVDLADETLFVVITTNNVGGLAGALSSLGGRDIREFPLFGTVTAFLPLANVIEIAGRGDVLAIAPRELMRTNKDSQESQIRKGIAVTLASPQKAGTVTWEGVAAHKANSAHSAGLTGGGAKVCVLSDGTDSVPARISSGDLPVSVLALSGQTGSGDEGTAMLEIVHDMAPGASLYFATALPSVAQFATNIISLYTVFGCHVIVDDITYLNEGAFQDGPIAQAVNSVTASGAIFLSSAGNSGNLSDGTSGTFEGDFVASLVALPPAIAAVEGGSIYPMHMFGALPYTTLTAESEAITLKWSDPLGGAINDYDLFVMDSTGTAILEASISAQTGTQSPFEIAVCSGCAFPVGSRIYVVRYS
ncbi:MAG TPA: hypothetical protein VFV90_06950, partial [Usitatibacter sp.]|nr:hypothetical protein [Usitatibacter sp.]